MVFLGVTTFSELEFNALGSLPRLIAAGRGEFEFVDKGGVNEAIALLPLRIVALDAGGVDASGTEGGGDRGGIFFNELRRSRLGTRLQVGCRTGRPLILATAGVVISTPVVTLALELHISFFWSWGCR